MSKYLDNHGDYNVRVPDVDYLDTNGDGTGSINANGNYATPTTFFYAPPAGEVAVIEKMIIHIASKGLFTLDGYGSIPAGTITTGYDIIFRRLGTVVTKLNNGKPIVSNADLAHINTDYRLINYANNYDASNVSLDAASFGGPLFMVGDLQDQLEITLLGDYSGLEDHHFILYGVE